MKKIILTSFVALLSAQGFAQNDVYINKSNTFHKYDVTKVGEIGINATQDSVNVSSADFIHAFPVSVVDSITFNAPSFYSSSATSKSISETFATTFGSFTTKNIKGTNWVIDYSSAKGTGYESSVTTESESYLVSPGIDLSNAASAELSFRYILRYVADGTVNKVLITDMYTGDPETTTWTDITGTLTEGKDWYAFSTYSLSLPSRFLGESNVVIAFQFACTSSASATWEVKNVTLKQVYKDTTVEDGDDVNNTNKNTIGLTNPEAWRLEYPHTKGGTDNLVIVKRTDAYGITYSLEWDCSLKANRWTCYEMYEDNSAQNVSRSDNFQEDPDIPSQYRSTLSDYSGSGFSRGHLCPSADRLCSKEQNSQTFYLSNMQPQWQNHNGVLWGNLETLVRNKFNADSYRDTLYVVKAATIENYGSTSGVAQYTNSGLIVPAYFYMAILAVKDGKYKAIGFWTVHENVSDKNTDYKDYAVSIDELETKTGIDFFCNLPDDVEKEVEKSYTASDWGL